MQEAVLGHSERNPRNRKHSSIQQNESTDRSPAEHCPFHAGSAEQPARRDQVSGLPFFPISQRCQTRSHGQEENYRRQGNNNRKSAWEIARRFLHFPNHGG